MITVLTGSLISPLLGLLLLVSRQLRVGLFELDALQQRLQDSRKSLEAAETEQLKARQTIQRIEAEELAPLRQQKRNRRGTRAPDPGCSGARRGHSAHGAEPAACAAASRPASGSWHRWSRTCWPWRRGSAVLQSGEDLAIATVQLEQSSQAKARSPSRKPISRPSVGYAPVNPPTARSCWYPG